MTSKNNNNIPIPNGIFYFFSTFRINYSDSLFFCFFKGYTITELIMCFFFCYLMMIFCPKFHKRNRFGKKIFSFSFPLQMKNVIANQKKNKRRIQTTCENKLQTWFTIWFPLSFFFVIILFLWLLWNAVNYINNSLRTSSNQMEIKTIYTKNSFQAKEITRLFSPFSIINKWYSF